jgi:hypothetical protein
MLSPHWRAIYLFSAYASSRFYACLNLCCPKEVLKRPGKSSQAQYE